ncbi:hypothetical protein EVAR_43549_1 [Eumeta japonica]|uniref:Uncharacterized protein n=1 Tax=Eumeta variegata TaxID=151549 RepID=A0A4C1W908_EUMVA|nr:hypothetical protein EVAR_43549_1 [Eumeta japonica]
MLAQGCKLVTYATLTEYRRELAASTVAFRPVNEFRWHFALHRPASPTIRYRIAIELVTFPEWWMSTDGGDELVSIVTRARVWAIWPAVAVAFTCAHPICTDRMRTGKRNRHRRPDSPDPNPKSKRDDISINQLT